MTRTYPLAFYNIDNGRDPDRVAKEIRALLEPRPAVLGLCETTSIKLPGVEDYRLLRDTSRPGRDNISAYVKTNLEVSGIKWHDCQETWTRTERPGTHPPRSILEFRAGRLFVMVHHQPPKGTDNTHDAQVEGINKLTARMAPWTRNDWEDRSEADQEDALEQARVVLWDANRRPDEDGPGPGQLAEKISGWNAGQKIDLATYRGGQCEGHSEVKYPTKVAGVEMRSDHDHAYQCQLHLVDG